jgi:2-isopropylmalate synthase
MRTIQIYDTTLRDGTQGEGVSLSLYDKLQITERLDEIGVDFIEGGYPLSNDKDAEYFERVGQMDLRSQDLRIWDDTSSRHLGGRRCGTPGIT